MKNRTGTAIALLTALLFSAWPRLCADPLSELNGVSVNNVKIPFYNGGRSGVKLLLTPLRDRDHKELSLVKTGIRFVKGEQDLTITFRCEEPRMGDVVAVKRKSDDQEILRDNCVGLLLNPSCDRKTFYQVIVNSEGCIADQTIVFLDKKLREDRKWNSGAKVVISKAPGEWSAEIVIPLSSLPGLKERMVANLCRSRTLKGAQNYNRRYCLGPSVKSFHDVENFETVSLEDRTLQAMIFANEAEYRAKLLYGKEVILDLLQKNVDPDRIGNDWKLRLYPLRAPLKEVARFWIPRLNYCDAVIYTPEGALDQPERSAAGDKLVQMRSPTLDLDGVGFAADFKSRQIKVNSNVRLIMRMASSDPRKFGTKLPEKYEFLEGRSEMLHMDTARNRIMLLGKVVIFDEKSRLTCDRLTVQLGSDKKIADRSSVNFSGISAIYADGNVKMVREPSSGARNPRRWEIYGDHMVYDAASGQVTLTGDRTPPRIVSSDGLKLRGKELVYFRGKRQLIVPRDCWMSSVENGAIRYLRSDYGNLDFSTGHCDFLGNVRGSAPMHELACDKMRVFLHRKKGDSPASAGQTAASRKKQTGGTPLSDAGDFDMGSMEFDRALCRGHVKMLRAEGKNISTLDSERAELDYAGNKAFFSGNVKALSDGNTLETEKLVLNLKKSKSGQYNRELESAETLAPVRIAGTTDPATKEISVITADRGFFDYKRNRVDFLGSVQAGRGKSTLKSDKLELFLAPGGKGDRSVALPGVTAGSGKTLKNAVATGNAVMTDGRNNLQADRLEFNFVPAPHGAPQEPGIFQSGSLRLTRVTGDGNVLLRAKQAREPKITPQDTGEEKTKAAPSPGSLLGGGGELRELRASRMVSDMLKRRSVFSGHVVMTDEQNRLNCEELTFYAKAASAAAAAAGNPGQKPAPVEDVDADPYDLPVENKVPSSVVLGNGLELDRAVAKDDVVLRQKKGSEESDRKFVCERAEFKSSDMTVVCTGTEEERPSVETEFKVHEADKFILHLRDERLETIGDVVTR